MKEKPILFNAEMVRAILEGRKTVTRRVIKPHYKDGDTGFRINRRTVDNVITGVEYCDEEECGTNRYVTPPYQTGDILYVRETWRKEDNGFAYYATDWHKFGDEYVKQFKWNPSIHMPKEAARIWLRVTDVRVERLKDMTVEDCKAEGIYDDYNTLSKEYHDLLMKKAYPVTFKKLWDSTISKPDLAKYGWDANPWVFVVSFEKIEKEKL